MSQNEQPDIISQYFQQRAEEQKTNESGLPDKAESLETAETAAPPSMAGSEDLMAEADAVRDSLDSENTDSDDSNTVESAELSLPDTETTDSDKAMDIETVLVKGTEGRKEKVKIDYSDRKAIKQAFLKAAGMRKFQAERDAALKTHRDLEKEHDGLKKDFDKIEQAFAEHGAKGIVALLGGEDAWQSAVDDELSHRDYVSSLTADEKYQLELKKRDEQYKKQLSSEQEKREMFQKQVEEREEQAALRELESKLHPSFDRYRFAGKLDDPAVENMYDQAIWDQVRSRLGEYPDDVELSQAIIDKEFRTVSSKFKKHIKTQTEKQVKKTVEKKKTEAEKRANVTAKKGLKGNTQREKVMKALLSGDLSTALNMYRE